MSYRLSIVLKNLMRVRNELSSLLSDIIHGNIDEYKAKSVVSNAIYDISKNMDELEKLVEELKGGEKTK